MSRIYKISIVLLILASSLFGARDLPIFHEWVPDSVIPRPPIYHWVLSNGLHVAFWENHTTPRVSARILILTGSAHEDKYMGSGISHYLEHVVSGGTTKFRTENEYKKIITENSLATNAYTNKDVTCYYGLGPAKAFIPLMMYLSENVQACAFDSFEINREKGVIVQEIRKGNEEPRRILYNIYSKAFYRNTPYMDPTIGYEEKFLELTRKELKEYYNSRYAPNNAILVIAGDLDTSTVKSVVDSLFGSWERKRVHKQDLAVVPLRTNPIVVEKEADVEVSQFRMGIPTTLYGDDDDNALWVLSMIFSGASTSRLDMKLVNCETPLANSIGASAYPSGDGRGQFIIRGSFDYQNRDKLLKTIWNEIDNVKTNGVKESEVQWAKVIIRKRTLMVDETVNSQTSQLMYRILNNGTPFTDGFFLLGIDEVTPEYVQEVAKKYLKRNRMTLAIVKPIGAKTPTDIQFAESKVSQKPEFTLKTLPNGLRLLMAENNSVPTLDFSIYIHGGSIYEPPEQSGLAYFTASYIGEGSKKYPTFEKLQGRQDDLNINISHIAGRHTIYIQGKFLASDFDDALELVSEILMNPTFPKSSEEKVRNNQIAQFNRAKSSWAREANILFDEKFYNEHPYSRPTIGYPDNIINLTSKAAKAYWEKIIDPSRIVLAISGPMKIEEMVRRLTKVFGKLKKTGSVLSEISIPEPRIKPDLVKLETNRSQITLKIGYDACASNNENDKWTLRAITGLLSGGGGLTGWLNEELRGIRNLVYISWASLNASRFGGDFTITTQFQQENFDSIYVIILRLIEKIKSGDFTEEELNRTTNVIAERSLLGFQRQSDLVSDASLNELYGFGYDYHKTIAEKIRSVNKEDVIRVSNKYLKNPLTVILHPPSFIKGSN